MNIDFITTDYTGMWMEQDEYWVEVPTHYPGLTLSPYYYNEPKTFYIPITISSLRYLTVIGYSSTGSQLFNVTKDLGSARTIEPNHMYTIPTIEF